MTQPYHLVNGFIPPQKHKPLSPSSSSSSSSTVIKSPTQPTSSKKTLGVRRTYTAAALAALANSPLAQTHNHALNSRGALSSAASSLAAAAAASSWPHSAAAAALATIDVSLWSVAHASAKATEQRTTTATEPPIQSQDSSILETKSSSSTTIPTNKGHTAIAPQVNPVQSSNNTTTELSKQEQSKTQNQQHTPLSSKTARATREEEKEVITVHDDEEDEDATDTDATENDTETDSSHDDKQTTESDDYEQKQHTPTVRSKPRTTNHTQKQSKQHKKQSEEDNDSDNDNDDDNDDDKDATDDDLPNAQRRGGRRGRGRALSMSAAEMTATLRSMQQEGVPLDIMHIRTRLRVSNNIVGLIKRMYLQTGSVDATQIQQARDNNNKRRAERLKRRKEREEEKREQEMEETEDEESIDDSEETSSTTDTQTTSAATASNTTTPSTTAHNGKSTKTFIEHIDSEKKQHSPPIKQRRVHDDDTTDSSVASLIRHKPMKKKTKRKRSADDDDGDDFVTHVIPTEYPNIPGGTHRALRRRRQVDYTSQLEEDPLTIVELNWYADRAQQPFQVYVDPSVHVMLDIHAHLADTEVIGLLAGHWSSPTQTISLCAAYPCRSVCTDDDRVNVEMDAASLVSVSDLIHIAGLQPMGWYHSHPYFRNHPSMVDVDNQEKYQAMFMQEDQKEQGHQKTPFIASIITPYGSGSFIPLPADIKWFFNSHDQHVKEQAATIGVPAIPMELWIEVALQQQQPGNKEDQSEAKQWAQSYEYIVNRTASLIAEYASIWSRVNFAEKWQPNSHDRDRPQSNGDTDKQDSEGHTHHNTRNEGTAHPASSNHTKSSSDQESKEEKHDDDSVIPATPLTPPLAHLESVDSSSSELSSCNSPVLLKSGIRTKRDAFCYSLWQHLSLCTGYTNEQKQSILQTVLQGIDAWPAKGSKGKRTKTIDATGNNSHHDYSGTNMSEERKE